jgi:hypothetical protein
MASDGGKVSSYPSPVARKDKHRNTAPLPADTKNRVPTVRLYRQFNTDYGEKWNKCANICVGFSNQSAKSIVIIRYGYAICGSLSYRGVIYVGAHYKWFDSKHETLMKNNEEQYNPSLCEGIPRDKGALLQSVKISVYTARET